MTVVPVIRIQGHLVSAWNCDEPYDGPTTREQTCTHPDCER